MDLKSMLNDAAANRPPRLHTPQSSFDRAAEHTPASDHGSARQTPYPPLLQPVDSRTQSSGSYVAIQSPHQINSATASTPSVGPHSAYAQSPGTYPQNYTPREGMYPQHQHQHQHQHHNNNTISHGGPFVSPSPSSHHPPTPGSAHHPNHNYPPVHTHGGSQPPQSYHHSPQSAIPNGAQHPFGRQISPQQMHQPVTPLGPPLAYTKASPLAQRPPSQGYENHLRRASLSSLGSAHSREHNNLGVQSMEHTRKDGTPRHSMPEIRERDRSMSVSPKTIPRPSPFRDSSAGSHVGSQGRPSIPPQPESNQLGVSPHLPDRVQDTIHHSSTPTSVTTQGELSLSRGHSGHPSPATGPPLNYTPKPSHSSLPAQYSSPSEAHPKLKRDASYLTNSSSSSQPPKKRLRRNEVPHFAQSAREKSLRLGRGQHQSTTIAPVQPPPPVQQRIHSEPSIPNGHATTTETPELPWESSIANYVPFENLTRNVCDWIVQNIGMATPPSGGAVFEIEAKIGEIYDVQNRERLRLPVLTETIFDRDAFGGKTKFESSMNMQQHKALNEYLNGLVRDSLIERQKGSSRQEILFSHPKENDEFFELTEEGRRNLHPSIQQWLNPRHTPRVRRTTNKLTGQVEAQIIKSRIKDMDIYNPAYQFDYRISISIESPWEGQERWLLPTSESGNERRKDRMSYRHMAYQVDLTQVSYTDKPDVKEHELEVEISTPQIRKELDNLRAGRPDHYEDLIRGLIDNVRLLCRKGTVH